MGDDEPHRPAGTFGRPPLPVEALDPRATAILRWREEHLPLRRVRTRSSWQALQSVEATAVWRLASKLELDDDQRYSFLTYHRQRVEQRMTDARPDLAPEPPEVRGQLRMVAIVKRRRRRWLRFTIGWGTWFHNRWVGIRDRWFTVTTLHYYRAAPRP
jgi:hypothetical protein